jgi:glycine cleavage system aminomethyltransferase T/glycine/D-amino acid oxidase-like deaminating enzyme
MPEPLPARAQVVVVGGGVIGCSVAYHLTKVGVRDVLLLEKHQLTAGTTWHAAGLITSAGYATESSVWMARYSRDLYARLEEETGHSTGFRPVGHLHIATDEEHVETITRERDFQVGFGVPHELISGREVAELFPLAKSDDVLLASYVADEGRADPVGVATSLAKGAELGGATVRQGVTVTGFVRDGRRVTGVVTDLGTVECETVVLTAGLWTRQLAATTGVDVPLQAAEHYYLLTEPMDGVHRDLPILEDPGSYGYFREEGGGLLVGLFEPVGKAWKPEGAPLDFAFGTLPPDYDRVTPYLDNAMLRIPTLENAGIRLFFCGPESFTHDVAPMVGPVPEVDGMWVAAGLNSVGILSGGGIGLTVATWIAEGVPPVDMAAYSVERAQPFENSLRFRTERTVEQLGVLFGDGLYPTFQQKTARNIRRAPLHETWARRGAHFAVSHGWEYPEWFAPSGVAPEVPSTWRRGEWTPWVADEHRTVREAVGVIDMTLMSKLLVQGPDAGAVLDRLSAGAVVGAVGRVVYTQWLNEAGGIMADLTVTRLDDQVFLVVVSDISHRRVERMLHDEVGDGEVATVTDVTSAYALLQVQGPRSRELLARVSPDDLSETAFPYLTAREVEVGYSRVLALRVTYVGELGFELYVPSDQAVSVWETLEAAGGDLGLRPVGLQAANGLRLEKAYRDYGVDIDNTDTPVSAGLAFAVAWDKETPFRGRDALLKVRGDTPSDRLVSLLVEDPQPLLYGSEPVHRDGVRVGHVQAGGYGYTLGGAVGLATVTHPEGVTAGWLAEGGFEVVVAGVAYPVRLSLRPFYDPDRTRVTG